MSTKKQFVQMVRGFALIEGALDAQREERKEKWPKPTKLDEAFSDACAQLIADILEFYQIPEESPEGTEGDARYYSRDWIYGAYFDVVSGKISPERFIEMIEEDGERQRNL